MQQEEIATKKTIAFLERHLGLLPCSKQDQDPNKLAIVFYSLNGLAALDVDVSKKYIRSKEWIRGHYVKSENERLKQMNISGFIGSSTMNIPGVTTLSLPITLFALLALHIMKDDEFLAEIAKHDSLFRFVTQCQLDNGAFVSSFDYFAFTPSAVDTSDLRFCYVAVAILYLLGCRLKKDFAKFINVTKLIEYILSQCCDQGGFGEYNEAHAGFTSCALSTLQLLDSLDALPSTFRDRSIAWILHRQVSSFSIYSTQQENPTFDEEDNGGFQGRENKYADTCYAFWCLNSLSILTTEWRTYCDVALVSKYLLLQTHNTLIGGFSKTNEDDPDLYHTCLGIAALKLIAGTFNGPLCIPNPIAKRLQSTL